MAMIFDSLNALERAEIVGTDISRPRLKDAQHGVYSAWALRSTPEAIRQRYFRTRGRYFELDQRIRAPVSFRYLNLAEDEYPAFSTGIWGMDIILCRNVLIYFDAATVARVATRLLATLSDDGWLVLGASDPPLADRVPCEVVMTDGGLVYRRARSGQPLPADLRRRCPAPPAPPRPPAPPAESTDPLRIADGAASPAIEARLRSGAPLAEPALPATDANPAASAILDAYARRDFDAVCRLAEPSVRRLTAPEFVAWLRALANRGHLERARAVHAQAVAAHGESAELCYLDAVLLLEANLPHEAAAAARKALYLDRGLAVAHVVLANARQRTHDRAGARRALHNAAALLEKLPADTFVPAADGETAHRLAELVKVNLRMLTRHDT